MKAISIRQPWVFAILNADKRVENRSRHWSYRGPVLLHASKGMTRDEYDDFATFYEFEIATVGPPYPMDCPNIQDLQRGGIVGKAVIIECVPKSYAANREWATGRDPRVVAAVKSPWFFGPYGLILDKVEAVPFVACQGALGLFDVLDDILTKADKQPDMLV